MFTENNNELAESQVAGVNDTLKPKMLVVGESDFLTVADETSNDVIWTSDDPNVANVNPYSGMVTALHAGNTTIQAIAQNGVVVNEYAIAVDEPILVTDVYFNESTIVLNKCECRILLPTVSPENADNRRIKLESSDPRVVAVVTHGVVRVISAGTAII